MINTFSHIENEAPLKKRAFSALIMLILSAVLFWCARRNGAADWRGLIFPAVWAFLGIVLMLPFVGKKVFFVFTLLAAGIGFVLLNTVTLCFYYLLFTPLALALRLAGKNLISQKPDRNKKSNWQDHRPVKELEQYLKQY